MRVIKMKYGAIKKYYMQIMFTITHNNNGTLEKKLLNKQFLDDCPGLMLLQHILRTGGGIYSYN